MSQQTATFGAGCFWGVEARFRELEGVSDAAVGYSGGQTSEPTYREVCSGNTGHAEVVQLHYDASVISYEELLNAFFSMHNPTTRNRQGPDVGSQYRSAIYWHNVDQRAAAEQAIQALNDSGRFPSDIVTEVAEAGPFWRAEEYHQQYLAKNGRAHCPI